MSINKLGVSVLMLAVAMAIAMTGCNTAGCTDNQNSLPLAGFYDASTGAAVSLDSLEIHGIGAPGDSMLYTPGRPISEAYLPFRSTAPSSAFCFHYCNKALSDPALNDTLTFDYTATPYFAGEECGAMYRYHIHRLGYTTHLIDSVAIEDSLITNQAVQQIHIYFKVATSEAEEGGSR